MHLFNFKYWKVLFDCQQIVIVSSLYEFVIEETVIIELDLHAWVTKM